MISLNNIAEICGVSLGTVSKAIGGKPGVGEATRRRILTVAQQHNYRPNRLVHSIQRGRSMMIGVACNRFDDEFAGGMVTGIFETLFEANYDAMVIYWDRSVQKGVHVLNSLAERRVDGILMFPPASYPEGSYLDDLRSFPNPIIVLDQAWPGCEYDFIGSQDIEGALLATEHLIELGHRSIAHLGCRHTSTGEDRMKGFQKAMMRHGIAIHEKWVRDAWEPPFEDAYKIAREILEQPERPSAIMTFNDMVALQTMAAAHDLGLRVPTDLSVTGFGDLSIATPVRPQITTVKQDPEEIGRRAAQRLIERIEAKSEDQPRPKLIQDRLPTRLVVRQSTAPCQSAQ